MILGVAAAFLCREDVVVIDHAARSVVLTGLCQYEHTLRTIHVQRLSTLHESLRACFLTVAFADFPIQPNSNS